MTRHARGYLAPWRRARTPATPLVRAGWQRIAYTGGMETRKRLERSATDRWIGGVCGGLGTYFNIDATVVRLIFLVAFFGFGTGLLVYLVLWFVMPVAASS